MERYFKRKSPFSIEENDDIEKSRKDIFKGARVLAGSRTLLSVSIDCVRFLTRQGLVFDDDEFAASEDQRDFIQLLRCLADQNAEIKAIMENAPENLVLISRDIQNDIASVAAVETLSFIIEDIGDALFSILLDKSPDVSQEEQMSIVLRYMNNTGDVVERFMGIEHVSSATSLSLKASVDKLFSRYGLSISRLRGQVYDVTSDIQGEFNGLKELILKENPRAFYIHCFAYRLEGALVDVAKNHMETGSLFSLASRMVNIVGVLSNRCDLLREKQAAIISNALQNSEISSGQSLNQHNIVNSPHDAHWGSHYGTLTTLITMFSPILDVLEMIIDVESCRDQRFWAKYLLDGMPSFDFAFSLHLMRTILGISNELSKALQRNDEDIVNAISLVKVCKQQLQVMRENGWDSLLEQVCSFCQKHDIDVPNMDGTFIHQGRSGRNTKEMTNLHYFREGLFYDVIDMQLQELNDRFTEINNELLLCVACLYPNDSFSAFDKEKLLRLAQYYPKDFSPTECMKLDDQLESYITDMRSSKEFKELRGLSNLSKKLNATKKNEVYPLVYKLVNLALILPIATPTVERVLTATNIVKARLRNKIGDQWMNDNLVVYIENDVFQKIDDDVIMRGFRSVKTCWEQ
ncbi:zinc finger MYM-type protein 1-like isoform X2 [Olea europaea var. sylvestris]|nr:zinc finger MYM-type protein 1-like isoform X2 [Olea europaea var. sylvestris]